MKNTMLMMPMIAQRHDRAHHQRRDVEGRANKRQHVDEIDVRQNDIQQAIEHHVVGDVGRIEAELDQQLLDPQVLRRVFERAIEYRSRIDVGAAHGVMLSEFCAGDDDGDIQDP